MEKTLKQYSLKSENGEVDGSSSEDIMIKVREKSYFNKIHIFFLFLDNPSDCKYGN